jgi:hypothetical protein
MSSNDPPINNPIDELNAERYDSQYFSNIERPRANTISFNQDNISKASESIFLDKTNFIGADNQEKEGSCFAYTAARLITNLIIQIIPDEFTITSDESNLLNDTTPENIEKYKNCFLIGTTDLKLVRNILLSSDKCTIDKRYNQMLLYYYTLFTIKNEWGCAGGIVDIVLTQFIKKPFEFYKLNFTISRGDRGIERINNGFIISELADNQARNLIHKYISFTCANKIRIENKMDLLPLYKASKSHTQNWITDFPEGAKMALEKNMYVGFVFFLSSNQWKTIHRMEISNISPALPENCTPPLFNHIVVITHWEPKSRDEPEYITILNSWGTGWGNQGLIKISSENFYKFILSPSCKEFDDPAASMKFLYFNITQGRPLHDLNRPIISSNLAKTIDKMKTKKQNFPNLQNFLDDKLNIAQTFTTNDSANIVQLSEICQSLVNEYYTLNKIKENCYKNTIISILENSQFDLSKLNEQEKLNLLINVIKIEDSNVSDAYLNLNNPELSQDMIQKAEVVLFKSRSFYSHVRSFQEKFDAYIIRKNQTDNSSSNTLERGGKRRTRRRKTRRRKTRRKTRRRK